MSTASPAAAGLLSLPLLVWPHSDAAALAAAAERVGDWAALIEQAKLESLTGLLAARLLASRPACVPAGTLAELERLRREGAQRSLRMTGQLVRILTLLERHGIEALPIKGPALAQDLYGDPTVRSSCDLDVVVRPSDAPEVRRLLLKNGFEDMGTFNERVLARGRHNEGEITLRRGGGEPVVDLHWQVSVAYSTRVLSAERLFAGARRITLLDREVLAPGLGDQLLMTLLHGARHQWQLLELRLAAAVQVERLPRDAWPAVWAAAREVGCRRRAAAGVVFACRPFGAPVPPEIRQAAGRDAVTGGYLRYLGGRVFVDPSAEPGTRHAAARHLSKLWWIVRSEDSAGDAVRLLAARGFLPGREDWEAVSLPKRLAWLYWVLRPVRLAAKYASAHAAPRGNGART